MKGKVKITLTEFGDEKTIPLEEFKDWFPSGRFDKRCPDEYLRKWLKINNTYLDKLNITYRWDEEKKSLSLIPGNKIGLVPLKNPYGRNVYGSIEVKPRLGWINLYEIFDLIDWKYQPTFLKNEEPILSNGVFPKWIKAIDTLEAINQALNLYMKGMNNKQVIINEPKGIINWYDYSIKSLPYGKYNEFYSFITDYSIDLEVHRQFKGIVSLIHGDIFHSKVPLKIKNKAKELVTKAEKKLENIKEEKPDIKRLKRINIPCFYRNVYERAIKLCIEYLVQNKFSLAFGNFYGLPWFLEMDRLFEYWVEHWTFIFAKKIGARFYSDIRKNSKLRFYNLGNWKSLSLLKPDIIIEKENKTLIIDVKYKKHLTYLQYGRNQTSAILEEHRHDLHQLLSYMSSSINEKRIGCLIYPKFHYNVPNQFATLINYTNIRANVDVILWGISFQPEELLTSLEYIWYEKYASFS